MVSEKLGVNQLQSTLESIDDIQRLKQLLRLATKADTLDTFINAIATSGED